VPAVSRPEVERFVAKITFLDDGCWLWSAKRTPNGYGQFWVGGHDGTLVYAHRWSYEFFKGPIPAWAELDHLCRNRLCASPWHLEAVTHRVNVQRGAVGLSETAKTHCPRGHTYDEQNTYRTPQGHRKCRSCHRAHALVIYHRQRAHAVAAKE